MIKLEHLTFGIKYFFQVHFHPVFLSLYFICFACMFSFSFYFDKSYTPFLYFSLFLFLFFLTVHVLKMIFIFISLFKFLQQHHTHPWEGHAQTCPDTSHYAPYTPTMAPDTPHYEEKLRVRKCCKTKSENGLSG